MKKSILTALFFAFIFTSFAQAQDQKNYPKREIGVRINGNSNFDLLFKKHKKENKYFRLRLLSSEMSLRRLNNYKPNISFGVAVGREKRMPISDRFSFVKGWELANSLSMSNDDNTQAGFISGIGLVLGVQYELNDHFNLSMETIPRISGNFSYADNHVDFLGLNAGFAGNKAAIGFTYKF